MKDLKVDLSSLCARVDKHTKSASLCSTRLDQLEAKTADLEDRNRRPNLRMVGLEENSEGPDAAAFLMKSLPQWFPSLADKKIDVMLAHCIYNGRPKTNDRPRTRIFNLLRYSDHQSILQAARKNPLYLSGKEIKFFPDYSNCMAQHHKGFSQLIGRVPLNLSTTLKNICLKQQQTLRSSWIRWGLLVRYGPNILLLPLPKGWKTMEEDPSPAASDLSSS
ncbi:UNVERIFIED_CONTAM: hypothetical protein FKN15_005093 [Acipenser sinensis]